MTGLLFSACQEVEGPLARSVTPPTTVSRSVAPGPAVYFLSSVPFRNVELTYYPYDTWVVIQPGGSFRLKSYSGARPFYTGEVYATGIAGGRNPCDLNVTVSYNGNNSGFGTCGGLERPDTVKARWHGYATRGSMPLDWVGDCSQTSDVCHVQDPPGTTWFVETAIPVKLNTPTVNVTRIVPDTVHSTWRASLTFSASRTPSKLPWNNAIDMPITITRRFWIGADSSRNPDSVGAYCPAPTANLNCTYPVGESGRMVVKAFTGGWEQTSSVTVQCLTNPADFILNDSASDFALRAALLEVLDSSHPELPAGSGLSVINHHGDKSEKGGRIVRYFDGTGYHSIPVDDPNSTECTLDPTAGYTPPAGTDSAGVYHAHAYTYPDSAFGCGVDSTGVPLAVVPGDGLKPAMLPKMEDEGGGSAGDWAFAKTHQIPVYVIWKDGSVYRLDPGYTGPHNLNPYHWRAFGPGARKCVWPRSYKE